MNTMKAIRIHHRGGPEALVYEDAPIPTLKPGDALVRVHAAGVSPAEFTWHIWETPDGRSRLPMTWGWMSKRPVPDEIMDEWFRPPLTQPTIRRDLRKYVGSVPPKKELLRWADGLRAFDRPALVVWATEDRVMPLAHGRRLAGLLPNVRLVEIPDSYTLIPEDQPLLLARAIQQFVHHRVGGAKAAA